MLTMNRYIRTIRSGVSTVCTVTELRQGSPEIGRGEELFSFPKLPDGHRNTSIFLFKGYLHTLA